jgi:hypothetical protein
VREEAKRVAINTAFMSSLASLMRAKLPLDGQIQSREVRETARGSNRGLLNDLEGSRGNFIRLVVVDCVLPELEAARDIHARDDLVAVTEAPSCNHTRLLVVIVRWDAVAEVEVAGGHNRACDIAAFGLLPLGTCALDAER